MLWGVGFAVAVALSYDNQVAEPSCLDEKQGSTYTDPCLGRCALPGVPVAGVLAAIAAVQAAPTYQVEDRAVPGTAKVLEKWGVYVDRYRGYIPRAVVGVRIYVEVGAGANPAVGPVGPGKETGLLQLWLCRSRDAAGNCVADCGYTEAQAKNPELNLKCMLPIWRAAIERIEKRFPALFPKRDGYEYWACMQLATMIGEGAFGALVTASGAQPGREYTAVRQYIEAQGEGLEALRGYFGSQSAASVARRVIAAERMTMAAAAIEPLDASSSPGLLWLAAGLGFAWYAREKGWI